MVSALLVWLLVGLSLVCYRFLTKHSDECVSYEPQDPPYVLVNIFYGEKFFSAKNILNHILHTLQGRNFIKIQCYNIRRDMINDIPRCLQKNNFKIQYVLKQFHIKIFYSDLRLKENQSDKKQIQ